MKYISPDSPILIYTDVPEFCETTVIPEYNNYKDAAAIKYNEITVVNNNTPTAATEYYKVTEYLYNKVTAASVTSPN